MRIYSKLVLLCNLCFVGMIILGFVERQRRANENFNAVIPLPALQATVAVLGLGAVFLNTIFIIFCLTSFLRRKTITTPKWIVWVNLVLLPLQVAYFSFSNFLA